MQESLQVPLQLTWRRGPDMPFKTHSATSVVIQGRLYVGGGYGLYPEVNKVMEYNISSGRWATLPPYTLYSFAMIVINNQLVLVGGTTGSQVSKELGVWAADRKVWTHPYPEMPTPRERCSAIGYNEWLLVAGGRDAASRYLSAVEVLNTDSKQWYTGPPTPIPWSSMKTTVVGNMAYFMGGVSKTNNSATENIHCVYHICIDTLISHITSNTSSEADKEIWKQIPGLQLANSTPLSIRGSLLALGGRDKDYEAVTAIHLYKPDSGAWVKVGDLPSARYNCTCAMTTDREIIVAGGKYFVNSMKSMDLGTSIV